LDIPIKDPVTDIGVGVVHRVLSVRPVCLDLSDQAVLVLLGALLGLVALGGQVMLQLFGVPAVVGRNSLVVPVGLDQVLQVFSVC
jgi:hypothetical protein